MKLKLWIIGVVGLFSGLSVMAQGPSDWSLTSAQPLQEIIGEEYDPYLPTLSPDGSVVGWWDAEKDQICVYHFADTQTTCYESPENMQPFGTYSYPSWSADGQRLAFTESFFDRLIDADIWVLDLESGQITNWTDDQAFGNMLDFDETAHMPVDYLPTWNPSTGELYFFRSTHVEGGWTTGLYVMSAPNTEPELIVDLTSLPILSIFRRASISPDGQRMAVNMIGQDPEDSQNGIYLVDLAQGDFTKVADLSEMQTGWPDWAKEASHPFPMMLFWSGDEALVVTSYDDRMPTDLNINVVYIDLASGDVIPLVDFTQVSERSEFLETDGPGTRLLRAGVVSPDGQSFWALRSQLGLGTANIVMVPLPPGSDEDLTASDVPDFEIVPRSTHETFVSSDGKALIYGWLLTFEPS